MGGKACIDASIALKWVMYEADSPAARELLEELVSSDAVLIAPAIMAYEVASVLRQKSRNGTLKLDEAEEAFEAFVSFPLVFVDDCELLRDAWSLARELNQHTVYDAVYLALARREDCPLWTADEKLFDSCSRELGNIRLLGR